MSYLLDTNVVSELRKAARGHARVRAWFESVDEDALFLSVLVVGELHQGIERIRRRDAASAGHLDRWLTRLVEDHADRILPVDHATASLWGKLNVPSPLPTVDGLLAATAMVHDLTLVTRNVKDVRRTGVRLLDPFS
ncbi:MAG TPA: type II toxin-antitoxin system VapC family toxin [Polyangia bacterium]|nr:type II toxin-antitoxin system VapC family toxin [Polyangia bacterium]